ncbi:hypothetical protein [Streptomyces sp. NPDC007083]|uniref:hypothetical protein n=1 Tax=unclassified Streptomyces TaxID=2593676 RepID=UPI0033CB87E7
MGTFLVKLNDDSEMIVTAGRAACSGDGDVTFEDVDARGNWCPRLTVNADRLESTHAYKVGEDGNRCWVRQPLKGPWWAY